MCICSCGAADLSCTDWQSKRIFLPSLLHSRQSKILFRLCRAAHQPLRVPARQLARPEPQLLRLQQVGSHLWLRSSPCVAISISRA